MPSKKIGMLDLDQLESFITGLGWSCNHCGNDDFLIEEYSNTGWCSVSAMPYVAMGNDDERFYTTGNGFPAYTVLCSNCFAVTKYHSIKLLEKLESVPKDD